jgi:hypothetical protein
MGSSPVPGIGNACHGSPEAGQPFLYPTAWIGIQPVFERKPYGDIWKSKYQAMPRKAPLLPFPRAQTPRLDIF